jgi:CheY-like chemotaxis protein
MQDPNDERWIKSTANELNNIIQVITESSEFLGACVRDNPNAEKYLNMLRDSVARAAAVTRQLAERVGGSGTDPDSPTAAEEPPSPRLFPADMMPAALGSAAATPIKIHNPTGDRELVMIVDDEDFVTMLASRVLAHEGYRIVTAKDGLQALDIYKRLKDEIALVILDFTMPVMDGADVFAELQQINPDIAVVLSSGFAEQDRLRAMLARGLKGFIPKPYTNQKLLEQVRHTLNAVKDR